MEELLGGWPQNSIPFHHSHRTIEQSLLQRVTLQDVFRNQFFFRPFYLFLTILLENRLCMEVKPNPHLMNNSHKSLIRSCCRAHFPVNISCACHPLNLCMEPPKRKKIYSWLDPALCSISTHMFL